MRLGDTPDAIAASLYSLGFKGRAGSCMNNPIANYLKSKVALQKDGEFGYTSPIRGTLHCAWREHWSDPYLFFEFKAISEFLRAFHLGVYRNLNLQ
jgi:hypothetical protein